MILTQTLLRARWTARVSLLEKVQLDLFTPAQVRGDAEC